MHEEGAYGDHIARRHGVGHAPVITARSLRKTIIAATEIRSDTPILGPTEPIPQEDAFLVALLLRDYAAQKAWEDGRLAPIRSMRRGQVLLGDLKRNPVFLMERPFHSIHFYVPRAALSAAAEDTEAREIGDLNYKPGEPFDDPTIERLGASLRLAFEHPEELGRLYLDHISSAFTIHVARTYGGLLPGSRFARGGLAAWQQKRVLERIDANLDGEVTVQELASLCGMSIGHFAKAFKHSVGVPPHVYLLKRRVEVAKRLLLMNAHMPLGEIGLRCGFANQSHFTRVFGRLVGASPGLWRRSVLS